MPWMPWAHEGYSLDESRKFLDSCARNWAEGTAYEFAILSALDGTYLGGCGLNHLNTIDRWANLGYWVRSSKAGQGIATKAATLLIPYGFNELKLNRIEIVVATGNKASQRVARKCGAKKEGILRNRLFLRGNPCDAVMFSLIPGE